MLVALLIYSLFTTGLLLIGLIHHIKMLEIERRSYSELKQLYNKHMKEQEVLYENNKSILFGYVDILVSEKNRNRFKNPSVN